MFSIQIMMTFLVMLFIVKSSAIDEVNMTMINTMKDLESPNYDGKSKEVLKSCLERSTKMMKNVTVDDENEHCHCIGMLTTQCIKDFCKNVTKNDNTIIICNSPFDYHKEINCKPIGNESWAGKISPEFCMELSEKSFFIPAWAMILIAIILVSIMKSSLCVYCCRIDRERSITSSPIQQQLLIPESNNYQLSAVSSNQSVSQSSATPSSAPLSDAFKTPSGPAYSLSSSSVPSPRQQQQKQQQQQQAQSTVPISNDNLSICNAPLNQSTISDLMGSDKVLNQQAIKTLPIKSQQRLSLSSTTDVSGVPIPISLLEQGQKSEMIYKSKGFYRPVSIKKTTLSLLSKYKIKNKIKSKQQLQPQQQQQKKQQKKPLRKPTKSRIRPNISELRRVVMKDYDEKQPKQILIG